MATVHRAVRLWVSGDVYEFVKGQIKCCQKMILISRIAHLTDPIVPAFMSR